MDTPALVKGGYTLGLTPIAFQYQGARVFDIRFVIGISDVWPEVTGCPPVYLLSALYKGGEPAVRLVVG
jgi:hypothetical protein